MKKMTALVLALVMTLSLLPMNVWATTDEGITDNEINHSGNKVATTDILSPNDIREPLDEWDYIGPVRLLNTPYIMGILRHSNDGLFPVKYDGNGIPNGGEERKEFAVGFWKEESGQMTLLTGDELDQVKTAFGDTLKIDFKLYTHDTTNKGGVEYPLKNAISNTSAIFPYPRCGEYVFNSYSAGKWLIVASGKYNGTYVEARGYTNQSFKNSEMIDASGAVDVDEINAKITDGIKEKEDANYKGQLVVILPPADDLEGTIVVPACGYEVIMRGATDTDGSLKTVLTGGIVADCSFFRAESIRFIGAGRNSTKANNYAISGSATGGSEKCTFTGYDCAIYVTDGIIGSNTNFFYDNNVGIYVVDPDGLVVGDHGIQDTVFAYNGTDVKIENEDGTAGDTKYYAIWDTIFIGSNTNISVAETLRGVLFVTKSAFDNGTGTTAPKIAGRASATPYYGLSVDGKAALHGLKDNSAAKASAFLAKPTFNKDWIDDVNKHFTNKWMCPEKPDDSDFYSVPGDAIEAGKDMTIDVMGDRGHGHECVATIKLEKKQHGEG